MSKSGLTRTEFLARIYAFFSSAFFLWVFISLFLQETHSYRFGFDFWDSYQSHKNFWQSAGSYHDPYHVEPIYQGHLNGIFDIVDYLRRVDSHYSRINAPTIQSHPVLGAWYFLPWLNLSIRQASAAYNGFQLLLFAVISLLIASNGPREYRKQSMAIGITVSSVSMLSAYLWQDGPIGVNLFWGQTNLIALFFIVVFWQFLHAEKIFLGGCILGLAIADKLFPILFVIAATSNKYFKILAGLLVSLLYLSLILFLFRGKWFLGDCALYRYIIWNSSYNPLAIAGPGSAITRFSITPSLLPVQIQMLLSSVPWLVAVFLWIYFSTIVATFFKFVSIQTLAFVSILYYSVVQIEIRPASFCFLVFVWIFLLMNQIQNSKIDSPLRLNLRFSLLLISAPLVCYRIIWDHHSVFIFFGVLLCLADTNDWDLKSILSRIYAVASICLLVFVTYRIDIRSWEISRTLEGWHALKIGSVGIFLAMMAIHTRISSAASKGYQVSVPPPPWLSKGGISEKFSS